MFMVVFGVWVAFLAQFDEDNLSFDLVEAYDIHQSIWLMKVVAGCWKRERLSK